MIHSTELYYFLDLYAAERLLTIISKLVLINFIKSKVFIHPPTSESVLGECICLCACILQPVGLSEGILNACLYQKSQWWNFKPHTLLFCFIRAGEKRYRFILTSTGPIFPCKVHKLTYKLISWQEQVCVWVYMWALSQGSSASWRQCVCVCVCVCAFN